MMALNGITSWLLAASVALFGCSQETGPNPDICLTPSTADIVKAETTDSATDSASTQWAHAEALAEHCVHRMAYRLAGGPDKAETIAQSALDQCSEPVMKMYVRAAAARMPTDGDYQKDAENEIRKVALYHVLAFRAGHCAVPKTESILPKK